MKIYSVIEKLFNNEYLEQEEIDVLFKNRFMIDSFMPFNNNVDQSIVLTKEGSNSSPWTQEWKRAMIIYCSKVFEQIDKKLKKENKKIQEIKSIKYNGGENPVIIEFFSHRHD